MQLDNNLIADIYFCILLSILAPMSLVTTWQVSQLMFAESNYKYFKRMKLCDLTDIQILSFVRILVKKRLWFVAIKLLESRSRINTEHLHRYFNATGFLYHSMYQYDLARVYYIKAVRIKSSYTIALQNLARVYEIQKKYNLAASTYNTVLNYDSSNKTARFGVSRMNNRDSRI